MEEGGHLLVSRAGADPITAMGITPQAMHAVALDRVPAMLWLASVEPGVDAGVACLPEGVHAYVPMTRQLTSLSVAGRPAQQAQ